MTQPMILPLYTHLPRALTPAEVAAVRLRGERGQYPDDMIPVRTDAAGLKSRALRRS